MRQNETLSSRTASQEVARRWGLWWCVLGGALVLFVATANRGVQWQDSGWQQLRIVTGELHHPLGLALAHPLQYYLGRAAIQAIPLEPAFAITLLSSFAGALAVASLALTLLILTRRILPALIPAAALMLSHTFWQHATYTESYTIVAALLTAEWLVLALYATTGRGRYLVLLALFNGLGLANHLLAALATPVDLAIIISAVRQRRLSIRAALAAGGLWIIGGLPYSGLVIATAWASGDPSGTMHSALFGLYASDVLNVRVGARDMLLAAGYIIYNFPGLTLPIAIYGAFRGTALPRSLARAWRWELLLFVLFAVRYTVTDQYAFYIPIYILLALFSGIGLGRILTADPPKKYRLTLGLALLTALWTPAVYSAAAAVLSARGAASSLVGNKPYRDGYQAFFLPWGVGQTYATELNDHAYSLAGDHGLILYEDGMMRFALRYAQATGRAADAVTVMRIETEAPEEIAAQRRALLVSYLAEGRPVVLAPRDRDQPRTCVAQAQWKRVGDLYLLTGMGPPPSRPAAASGPSGPPP